MRAHKRFCTKHPACSDKAQSKYSRVETRIAFRIPFVWHMTHRHSVLAYISSSQRTTTALPTLEDEATALSVCKRLDQFIAWLSVIRQRKEIRSYIAAKTSKSQKKAWSRQPACKIKPESFRKNKFDIYVSIIWCKICMCCWLSPRYWCSYNFYQNVNFVSLLKGKLVPLQAWSGPEGSKKLRFSDFMTTAQDGGKVVSLTHRPPLPSANAPGTHFC